MSKFTKGNSKAAKINFTVAEEIRRRYDAGEATQGSLAREYQMSVIQIGRIVRGESWNAATQAPREMTRSELDESAQRMLNVQREVELRGTIVTGPVETEAESRLKRFDLTDPVQRKAAALLGLVEEQVSSEPPPSPLDGGDAPDETDGSALGKLQEKAKESPAGLINELKGQQ